MSSPLKSAVLVFAAVGLLAAAPINFQRQVRPILSNNCFLCHGPDKGTRMADVRLDVREGAFAARKNGTIIVPGKPDESLLIKRIFSDQPGFQMPPPVAHKTLTAEQKNILRQWIQEGAQWKDHWSFVAPVRPVPPVVKNAAWVRNPVDNFILAKLETIGLNPAQEADKRTLLRRVTLDLTGLPPTPEEADAFVKDKSPKAYEKVVDRLLASPHYGEHMGHYWLDAARYADTQGLHIDNYREMWPYRDWVIKAFNKNMPFDQFTIEQLAGDLLPKATLEQKIASGFQRCNVTTDEGGAIPAEVEAMYARDRADTTGTVWMGLTVGCATCHDHKFDPIAQKEMYAMTAFFRNTSQYALDGNVMDTPPIVTVPSEQDRPKWDELEAQRAQLKAEVAKAADERAAFEQWLRSENRRQAGFTFAQVRQLKDEVHFGKEANLTLPNVPEIDSDKPFSVAAWVMIPKEHAGYPIASQMTSKKEGDKTTEWGWSARVNADNTEPSVFSISLTGIDGKTISATVAPNFGLKPKTWYHVVFSYDGSRQRRALKIYMNGDEVPIWNARNLNSLTGSIQSTEPIYIGSRNKSVFEDGAIRDFRVLNKSTDEVDARDLFAADAVEKAAGKEIADLSETERQALLTYYLSRVGPSKEAVAQLHAVDAARYEIAQRSPITFVQEERKDSEPTAHVLYRGLYDQPRDEVHPNVPAVLPPMQQSLPKNRLGLAYWLVDANNPLMSRVTVNRFWQQLFGTGLVKTAEDFGSQGEPPTHPELLDWMAVEFRESGWDVKKMMRLMVTSAAYRQAAITTPEKLEHDRDNRLISRGPRYRMDGEMVRDFALATSGLLVTKVGGPSVKPYQPQKVWETVAMDESNTRFYTQDTGEALYRRSLYTFWKRSAPPPSMDIFDAPSREECVVRRERTNTPLQALVTMDDPQFVEAARTLAQNAMVAAKGDVKREVNYMANRLLTRSFDEKERAIVMRSYLDYLAFYEADPGSATKLVSIGESKPLGTLAAPKLAAMTMVANELLNLDEVLAK